MTHDRDKQIATYVDADTKEQLKREARQRDEPLSKYLRRLIEQARLEDTEEQLARDLNAEERLEELIAEGKDELATIAEQAEAQNEQIASMLGKMGRYEIVNFQLLKATHDPPEAQLDQWFSGSADRLYSETDFDFDFDAESDSSDGETVDVDALPEAEGSRAQRSANEGDESEQDSQDDARSFVERIR